MIEEFLQYQPRMKMIGKENDNVVLEGEIFVNLVYDNYPVQQFFSIKIVLNKLNVYLSNVYEVGGKITDYHHKYTDERLCLATTVDLLIASCNDNSMVRFCQNFIEPYLYTYMYYTEYGFFPYGEREHDVKGVISSYREITGIKGELDLVRFLCKLIKGELIYRGHLPCPCGSGIKTRNCHPKIKMLIKNDAIVNSVINDCRMIVREINEYKRKTK